MNSEHALQQALATHLTATERVEFLGHPWALMKHAIFSAGDVVLRRQQPPVPERQRHLKALEQPVEGAITDVTPAYYLASVLLEIAALGEVTALSTFKMEYRGHLQTWYFNHLEQMLKNCRAAVGARELLAGDAQALRYNAYALAERTLRRWGEPGQAKRDRLDQAWLRAQDAGDRAAATCALLVSILELMETSLDRTTFVRILAECEAWTPRVSVGHQEVTPALYRLQLTLDQAARDSIGDDSVGFDLPSTHGWHFDHADEAAATNQDRPWLKFVGGNTQRGDQPWDGVLQEGGWQAAARWNNAANEKRFRQVEDLALAVRATLVAMLAAHATRR